MLPKIVLTLMQLYAGWAWGPPLRALIPANLGTLNIFLLAVIIAVLVWLVGHIGALVLKDTLAPSNATLAATVVLAAIGAALTLVPAVTGFVNATLKLGVPLTTYPLIGAVLGYLMRK
jgi:hypothetical protein